MWKRLRPCLTYANVMATVAVFVALGGGAYAAIQINGSQITNNSVSYKKLKRNTLGGTRIRESRLGKVPRAARADRLGGFSASQLRVRCPTATRRNSGACIELASRPGQPYAGAKVTCEVAGRRLPSYEELSGLLDDQDVTLTGGSELTGNVFASSSRPGAVEVLVVTSDTGAVEVVQSNDPRAFRCAVDPAN